MHKAECEIGVSFILSIDMWDSVIIKPDFHLLLQALQLYVSGIYRLPGKQVEIGCTDQDGDK